MTEIWPLDTGLAKYRPININKGDLEEFDWKKNSTVADIKKKKLKGETLVDYPKYN